MPKGHVRMEVYLAFPRADDWANGLCGLSVVIFVFLAIEFFLLFLSPPR